MIAKAVIYTNVRCALLINSRFEIIQMAPQAELPELTQGQDSEFPCRSNDRRSALVSGSSRFIAAPHHYEANGGNRCKTACQVRNLVVPSPTTAFEQPRKPMAGLEQSLRAAGNGCYVEVYIAATMHSLKLCGVTSRFATPAAV